jgi:hypothetical protein
MLKVVLPEDLRCFKTLEDKADITTEAKSSESANRRFKLKTRFNRKRFLPQLIFMDEITNYFISVSTFEIDSL